MADIVLHHSMLCIATEAPLGQYNLDGTENKYYAGIPNWAGYTSGIGIGLGFDIGASGYSPERIQGLMSAAGIEQWVIDELKATCYQRFNSKIPAEKQLAQSIVKRLKIDLGIKWTQQQCLDFLAVMKTQHNNGVKGYFPASYSLMHDAIKEVYVKVHYGAPAICQVAGRMYDSKLSKINDPIKQCDLCIESLNVLIEEHGGNAVYFSQYKSFIKFIKKVQSELKNGNKIAIDHNPITVSDLLKTDSCDYIALVQQEVELQKAYFGLEHAPEITDIKKREQTISYCNTIIKRLQSQEPDVKGLENQIRKTLVQQGAHSTIVTNEKIALVEKIFTSTSISPTLEKAQTELKKLGYYHKVIDGVYGPGTKAALKTYQQAKGINATGGLDKDTLKMLLDIEYNKVPHNDPKIAPTPTPENNYFDHFMQVFKSGKGEINGSVGVGGQNQVNDILCIRALLSKSGYLPISWEASPDNMNFLRNLKEDTLIKVDRALFDAIKKLQKDKGMELPSGLIAPNSGTLAILNGSQQSLEEKVEPSPKQVLDKRAAFFQTVQQFLIREGYLPATYIAKATGKETSSADGVWGRGSAAALKKLQAKYDLQVDGIPGKETIAFIQNFKKEAPKPIREQEETINIAEIPAGASFYPCYN